MAKRFRECSPNYMLDLMHTNAMNGTGFFIECDSVIRMECEQYTFHICQWGVITAERTDDYKPKQLHASYKCQCNDFNTLFNAIEYRARNHYTVPLEFFKVFIW